jgi:nicotinate phosphoribosyltransferase
VGKPSRGGRKWALRRRGPDGTAVEEVLRVGRTPVDDGDDRPLQVPLVEQGQVVGAEPLATARDRHQRSLDELPASALRLQRGEPAIPTVFEEGWS